MQANVQRTSTKPYNLQIEFSNYEPRHKSERLVDIVCFNSRVGTNVGANVGANGDPMVIAMRTILCGHKVIWITFRGSISVQ
jgi:hypothetical protein